MFNRFSTYGSPVNIRFPQGFKLPPQDFILGILRRRVLFHNTFSYGANVLQQLPVAYNIRNLQIESDAALLCTFKVGHYVVDVLDEDDVCVQACLCSLPA